MLTHIIKTHVCSTHSILCFSVASNGKFICADFESFVKIIVTISMMHLDYETTAIPDHTLNVEMCILLVFRFLINVFVCFILLGDVSEEAVIAPPAPEEAPPLIG